MKTLLLSLFFGFFSQASEVYVCDGIRIGVHERGDGYMFRVSGLPQGVFGNMVVNYCTASHKGCTARGSVAEYIVDASYGRPSSVYGHVCVSSDNNSRATRCGSSTKKRSVWAQCRKAGK